MVSLFRTSPPSTSIEFPFAAQEVELDIEILAGIFQSKAISLISLHLGTI